MNLTARTMYGFARPVAQMGMAAALLAMPCRALAYNEQTHQEMVDYAYELMLLMGRDPAAFAALSVNKGADPAFQQFVRDAAGAVPYLRSLPGAIPAQASTTCDASDYVASVPGDFAHKTLGEMRYALRHDYNEVNGCGLLSLPCGKDASDAATACHDDKRAYHPGGLFDASNPTAAGAGDYTGVTLGYWAAHVDHEFEDTRTQNRPTNMWGLGAAKREITDVAQSAFASLLVPFVCGWYWLSGNDTDCWKDSKDVARSLDPIENLEGVIPGSSNAVDPKWTGIWHFINMNPGASNDYDDIPGWYPPEAGPGMQTGLAEIGVIVASNWNGLSMDYEKAQGPRQYMIENANDYHANTRVRSEWQWEYATISNTVMEPIDNLAFHGWRQFLSYERTARSLQWPLHALGDAAEPHHVIGSSGWGHRPYEDAVSDRTSWSLIRFLPPADASRSLEMPSVRTPINQSPSYVVGRSIVFRLQLEQMVRVAENAFRWRQYIQTWRAQHPDKARDIPVRDMVTLLARETYDYSMSLHLFTGGAFPYKDFASVRYEADAEGAAIEDYTETANFIENVRAPVENSMAATLAFLTSVAEVP